MGEALLGIDWEGTVMAVALARLSTRDEDERDGRQMLLVLLGRLA